MKKPKNKEKSRTLSINRKENPQKLLQVMGRTRRTVGSRNPYAFVEHVLGVKIDWEHSSPAAIQRLLQKINEAPFYSIFDDLHDPIPDKERDRRPPEFFEKKKKEKEAKS